MPSISPEEQARRQHVIEQARHSTEMEGGRTDDEARAIQDQFVRGEITDTELIEKTHALVQRDIARENAEQAH